MTKPTYQLTKYPVGTLREIWAVSWPLMLGLLSASLMYFSDRLILAHYSSLAMTASANAGMATWGAVILPLVTVEITEVFVGRYNGEGNLKNVGKPVWQMLWLCLATYPLYVLGSRFIAPYLFHGTGNTQFESEYFITLCDFAPCFLAIIALSGFFIGTGNMKVVTLTMILGNVLNILLDIPLIFGFGIIPALGCKGAALATGIAEVVQLLILFVLFLKNSNREKYGTNKLSFDKNLLNECLKIAVPSGLGRFIEVLAHLTFFRIMISAGSETMTAATLVQSLYLLIGFIIDGLAKGSTAVFSNLFGAGKKELLGKVLRSALLLHAILFFIFAGIMIFFTEEVAGCFFSESEKTMLFQTEFLSTIKSATFWMTIFFLFDGFTWVLFGLFTAAGDTKFLMYVNSIFNWVAYVLPTYIVVGLYQGTANHAWMILAFYNMLAFTIYFIRYRVKIHKNLDLYQAQT